MCYRPRMNDPVLTATEIRARLDEALPRHQAGLLETYFALCPIRDRMIAEALRVVGEHAGRPVPAE